MDVRPGILSAWDISNPEHGSATVNTRSDSNAMSDEAIWRKSLATGEDDLEKRGRRIFARLLDSPRCKTCNAPFEGLGAPIVRDLFGRRESRMDPRHCSQCEAYTRRHLGCAEFEITTHILVKWDTSIDPLIGDGLVRIKVPRLGSVVGCDG
jgi:hypothetical protein